jgi:hypothetical protein
MIVVVGSQFDAAARAIVDRWPGGEARLLTADDLTVAGWRWSADADARAVAVVSGQRIDSDSIRGVLTRRPAVLPLELTAIADADRSYVAAETTAFLVAWLSSLSCPVLNRPCGSSLWGPNWTIDRWLITAAGLGIAVRPFRRTVPAVAPASTDVLIEPVTRVVVVGSEVVGDIDERRADAAMRLARAAGIDLLEARFCGAELVAATTCPDLMDPATLAAVVRVFSACCS